MKAKRILSLLLTVAMMLTCVTAFAAPVDGYVRTASTDVVTDEILAQAINSNATMPNLDDIKIDVDVNKATDDELKTLFGSRAIPSGWTGKGYLVEVTATDLGDLYMGWDTEYSEVNGGFGITQYKLSFVPVESGLSYKICTSAKGDVDSKIAIQSDNSTMLQSNTIVSGKHVVFPIADGGEASVPDASFTVKCAIFAEEGAQFNINNVVFAYSNLMYNEEFVVNRLTEDGKAFIALQAPAWHPATITLGTAAPEEPEDPEDPELSVGAADNGDAVVNNGTTYDNAIRVKAKVENYAGASEVGFQFIPSHVKDGDTVLWDKAAKAIIDGAILGTGKVDFNAVLVGIPEILFSNKTITILSRAYAIVDDVLVPGAETSTNVSFE